MSSSAETGGPIILFDGVCNLCAGCVRFVIEHDSRRQFRFASLQSPIAQRLLAAHGPQVPGDSMILIADGRIYRRSDAALLTARRLDAPWSLLGAFLVVPRCLRDAVYDWVGRRRYRLFGKRDVCWIPHADVSDRFLS